DRETFMGRLFFGSGTQLIVHP
uniref:Uncharacterized protein n=1 Tax=Sarcophilus harrisii TaxID=9305 RepID=A0A7N4P0G4_SARHA